MGSIVEERYRVEAELGAGAMGSVYRGRHVRVGRTVAIKVLHDHLVRDPEMVARFEREARIAAKLKHPNLVTLIDIGTTPDGKKMMVLEFAPGRPMSELVCTPLRPERVITLARQLLLGLEHAHGLGLVHRDLKPENVLVERTSDGVEIARIVDFGIAVLREGDDSVDNCRLTTAGMVLGTPMYMAPEQARGERVDHRADLFAMGVIVYEMLAGKSPFEGSGIEIMMQNITLDPPSILARAGRSVDPRLEAFARKLMAREASDRFQSATAALHALAAIEQDGAVRTPIEDITVTDRHARPKVAMPALRRPSTDEIPHTDVHPVPTSGTRDDLWPRALPPRRRNWGVAIGAAAFAVGMALALAICA